MRKFSGLRRNQSAEMGVGTLVIFIAMVLVAAVAGSVLIDAVDKLQSHATDLTDDTTDMFSTQLEIFHVEPQKDDDGELLGLAISIRPAYHSGPVDTSKMIVILEGGLHFYNSYLEDLGVVEEDEQANRYIYEFIWHSPSPKAYDDGDPYLRRGESGVIELDLDGLEYFPGKRTNVKLILDMGLPSEKRFNI